MKGSIRRQQDQLHLMIARLDQPSQELQDLPLLLLLIKITKQIIPVLHHPHLRRTHKHLCFPCIKKWNLGPAGQGPPTSKSEDLSSNPQDLSSIPNTHMMEEERANSCELSSKFHVCTMAGVFIHT